MYACRDAVTAGRTKSPTQSLLAEFPFMSLSQVVAQRQNIAELARSRQKENDLVNENTVLKAEVLKCRLDLAASAEEVNLQGIRVNDLQKQISELHMLRFSLKAPHNVGCLCRLHPCPCIRIFTTLSDLLPPDYLPSLFLKPHVVLFRLPFLVLCSTTLFQVFIFLLLEIGLPTLYARWERPKRIPSKNH